MNEIQNFLHSVYIFENTNASRIKVGITSDKLINRLNDLNDIWSGRKVICQVCGGRLVNVRGKVPFHVACGIRCPGSNALPIEKSNFLAKIYLNKMKDEIENLSGSEKCSAVRRINNLSKRIELFQKPSVHLGTWKLNVVYYTNSADKVEKFAHEILSEYLDEDAPIGEIFSCSVSDACKAVESALCKYDLMNSTIKKYSYEINI